MAAEGSIRCSSLRLENARWADASTGTLCCGTLCRNRGLGVRRARERVRQTSRPPNPLPTSAFLAEASDGGSVGVYTRHSTHRDRGKYVARGAGEGGGYEGMCGGYDVFGGFTTFVQARCKTG